MHQSGNNIMFGGCSIGALLVESHVPQPPTQYPIATPTHQPIATPTHQPSEKPIAEPTQKPTREPISSPTDKPTREPIADPTQEPTMYPTVKATDAPKDSDYCDYVFVKGLSSEDIAPGCALIAQNDLNYFKKGDFSPVIAVCARENHPVEITHKMLEDAKIDGVSYAKFGEDIEIDFYSEAGKHGLKNTVHYKDKDGGSLVHKKYEGGEVLVSDNIGSLYVKSSSSAKYKLPKDCVKGVI